VCRHLVAQVAPAEIVCHLSDLADAAKRWEDERDVGAGSLWFSAVLGLEGPTSNQSDYAHNIILIFEY